MTADIRRIDRPAAPRLYRDGTLTTLEKSPPPERAISLIVDGEELATIACSPVRVIALEIGRAHV